MTEITKSSPEFRAALEEWQRQQYAAYLVEYDRQAEELRLLSEHVEIEEHGPAVALAIGLVYGAIAWAALTLMVILLWPR